MLFLWLQLKNAFEKLQFELLGSNFSNTFFLLFRKRYEIQTRVESSRAPLEVESPDAFPGPLRSRVACGTTPA
jgi:hypothetical protein